MLHDEIATTKVKIDEVKTMVHDELCKVGAVHQVLSDKVTDIAQLAPQAPPVLPPKPSYANALSGRKHESNTLVIKANEGQSSDEMCKVVKSALKDVKIDKMRITPQNSVVLNLPDTASIDKAKNALQSYTAVTANNTKKVNPKIMVPYVTQLEISDPTSDSEKAEFVNDILNKNDCLADCTSADIMVVNSRKAKQGSYLHIILKCSPKARKAINQNYDMIYTTYGHHQIYDHYHVKICNHCQGYDHIEQDCKSKKEGRPRICGKCAENHDTKECNHQPQSFKCHQCTKRKLNNNRNHTVFDMECQAYKEQVRRLAQNTEHGF